MLKKSLVICSLASLLLLASSGVFACGGEASGKHIGSVLDVNTSNSTFTIKDAETNSPITFKATANIMNEVSQASGRIMVNYEEDDEGSLNATAIAF